MLEFYITVYIVIVFFKAFPFKLLKNYAPCQFSKLFWTLKFVLSISIYSLVHMMFSLCAYHTDTVQNFYIAISTLLVSSLSEQTIE